MRATPTPSGKGRARCRAVLAALCLCCLLVRPASADERTYKVEAAFLYNFFNYIAWPGTDAPGALQQGTICIRARDPIRPYLEYSQRRQASQERRLIIRPLPVDAINIQDISGCHILFLRDIGSEYLAEVQSEALKKGVLLVAEDSAFSSAINIFPQGDRLVLDINNTALKAANFKVSSRLLNLAREIR
jgi:hypothetical protein